MGIKNKIKSIFKIKVSDEVLEKYVQDYVIMISSDHISIVNREVTK